MDQGSVEMRWADYLRLPSAGARDFSLQPEDLKWYWTAFARYIDEMQPDAGTCSRFWAPALLYEMALYHRTAAWQLFTPANLGGAFGCKPDTVKRYWRHVAAFRISFDNGRCAWVKYRAGPIKHRGLFALGTSADDIAAKFRLLHSQLGWILRTPTGRLSIGVASVGQGYELRSAVTPEKKGCCFP